MQAFDFFKTIPKCKLDIPLRRNLEEDMDRGLRGRKPSVPAPTAQDEEAYGCENNCTDCLEYENDTA
jgi:hypothetical protein